MAENRCSKSPVFFFDKFQTTVPRHCIISTMCVAVALLCFLWTAVPQVEAAVEEIDITPSNTNGIELGELSILQLVFFVLLLLKLVTLYAVGVLPVEVDLGGTFTGTKRGFGKKDVSQFLKNHL